MVNQQNSPPSGGGVAAASADGVVALNYQTFRREIISQVFPECS